MEPSVTSTTPPAGYTRIHLDLEWVRTIPEDKNDRSRSDLISNGSLRPQESINTTISLLSTQALGQLQRRCRSLMEMKRRPDPWVKRDCRTHLKRASKCSFLAPTQTRFCSKHLKGKELSFRSLNLDVHSRFQAETSVSNMSGVQG